MNNMFLAGSAWPTRENLELTFPLVKVKIPATKANTFVAGALVGAGLVLAKKHPAAALAAFIGAIVLH
jgi:hypothetical protein